MDSHEDPGDSVPSAPVVSSLESYRSSMPSTLSQDLLHPMAHLCSAADLEMMMFSAGPATDSTASSSAAEEGQAASSSGNIASRKRERECWADMNDSPAGNEDVPTPAVHADWSTSAPLRPVKPGLVRRGAAEELEPEEGQEGHRPSKRNRSLG